MPSNVYLLPIIGTLTILSLSTSVFANEDKYATAAQQLQQRLGKVLMTTIQTEGHIAAISVCNEQAPAISAAVSQDLNLHVGRTALKVRNSDNAPSARQEQVLKAFVEQWQRSSNAVPSKQYTDADGKTVWMKAIVMQPQCAACHGSDIKPALKQAITARYPNDQATGFSVGDIRGAFVISER